MFSPFHHQLLALIFSQGRTCATEIAVTIAVTVVVVVVGVVGVVGVTCKIWKGKENQKNGKKS